VRDTIDFIRLVFTFISLNKATQRKIHVNPQTFMINIKLGLMIQYNSSGINIENLQDIGE